MLKSTRTERPEAIHDALVDSGRTTTTVLAAKLDLPVSTVSRHLNALARAGFADRFHEDGEVLYVARRHCSISFAGPLQPGLSAAPWAHFDWQTAEPIDWRYPLVGRVPDADAQKTLRLLLTSCDRAGLFHPWLLARHPHATTQAPGGPARATTRIDDPAIWGGLHFIAYGSCVRGDARPESDLDILVIADQREPWQELDSRSAQAQALPHAGLRPWHEMLEDIAHSINVSAPRGIDLINAISEPRANQAGNAPHPDDGSVPRLRQPGSTRDRAIPEALMASIAAEGVTVFSSLGSQFPVETWRTRLG